ncbi:MAG: hypothetical protein WKF97_18670 [Chitinophagaceae bacterium]
MKGFVRFKMKEGKGESWSYGMKYDSGNCKLSDANKNGFVTMKEGAEKLNGQ